MWRPLSRVSCLVSRVSCLVSRVSSLVSRLGSRVSRRPTRTNQGRGSSSCGPYLPKGGREGLVALDYTSTVMALATCVALGVLIVVLVYLGSCVAYEGGIV